MLLFEVVTTEVDTGPGVWLIVGWVATSIAVLFLSGGVESSKKDHNSVISGFLAVIAGLFSVGFGMELLPGAQAWCTDQFGEAVTIIVTTLILLGGAVAIGFGGKNASHGSSPIGASLVGCGAVSVLTLGLPFLDYLGIITLS